MTINRQHWIHDAREEAAKRLEEDSEYRASKQKYHQLLDDVTAAMPEEQRSLLMDLDDADANVEAAFETELYFVGIYHGFELAKFLEHPVAFAFRPSFKSDYEESAEATLVEALMSVREEQLTHAVHSDKKRLLEEERAERLYDQLRAKLPVECEKLLRELADAYTCVEVETSRLYYTEGLRQGRELTTFFTSRSLDIREANQKLQQTDSSGEGRGVGSGERRLVSGNRTLDKGLPGMEKESPALL